MQRQQTSDLSPRLLIVEDSEEDAQIILSTLEQAGFASRPQLVYSPQAMEDALSSDRWDLVIAGNGGANFNAEDALWLVQEQEHDLPVILLSWDRDEETTAAAFIAGATDYVVKSDIHRLVPVLRRELFDETPADQDELTLPSIQEHSPNLELLAGGVAHDFNNLLVAILGQCSVALESIPNGSPARDSVLNCIRDAERASDLTQLMLAYTGYQSPPRQPTDLNKLIRDYLPLLESAAGEHVILKLVLAEALPEIVADAGQVQKAIFNLIANVSNAVEGPVEELVICSSLQEAPPESATSWSHFPQMAQCERYVALELRETRSGLNGQIAARIFEPFLSTTDTKRLSGLGSVLATVRGHRGGMLFGNRSSKGTLFKILFPTAQDDCARTRRISGNGLERRKPVVLVIDDETPVRDAIKDILEIRGISVLTAANGRQGLQIYGEHMAEIDLVLLDYSMPGLDGPDTLDALLKLDQQAPVMITSGYNQADLSGRFNGRSPIEFLPKPFSAAKLTESVETALGFAEGKSV